MAGDIKQFQAITLMDLIQNPEKVQQLIDALNLVLTLQAQITPFSGTKGTSSLYISGQNIVLPLPIQLPAAIPDPLSNTASNTATIKLILAGMRSTTMLPGTG